MRRSLEECNLRGTYRGDAILIQDAVSRDDDLTATYDLDDKTNNKCNAKSCEMNPLGVLLSC